MITQAQILAAEDVVLGPKYTIHLPGYLTGFLLDIKKMNEMYELQEITGFVNGWCRIEDFQSILREECNEIDEIRTSYADARNEEKYVDDSTQRVMMADLLGDIIVYCASEAMRWNIPIDRVLHIIMQSNFSKLDENGKPIKDERGKFLKGPNYWKPEPKIAALLKGAE